MSQIGNTDWEYEDESSTAIFTDTYIDEDASNDEVNYDGATANLIDSTSSNVQAIIKDISIPKKDDLLDSNSNPLPSDVTFSKIEMRLYLNSAPSQDCTVYGMLLSTKAIIPNVSWNFTDGTTAWNPDFNGDGTNAIVHTDQMCRSTIIGTGSTGYVTFTFQNLSKNDITFGSNFQLILYVLSSTQFGFKSIDHSGPGTYAPNLKIYFRKPNPDAATITVTPNTLGLTGDVNITAPTKDGNLQKYYVCWDADTSVIQSNNTYTLSDTGVTKIPIKDLTQEAKGGTPAYTKTFPQALPVVAYFRIFSEDLYNTTTNATGSNTAYPGTRPVITSFSPFNAAEAADAAPAIGEEMTLTITDDEEFTQYAINFDVEASLVDTGITWEDDVGGSTMTSTTSNAAHTKLYNSDPDGFEIGDMLKMTSAAGAEFMMVVGDDSGFTVVQRAQMNTAAVDHTGLVDTTKIYKVNYDDFYFIELDSPATIKSIKHTFSKASVDKHTNHVAAMVKDGDGWCSNPISLNGTTGVTVAEANPIAKLTTSRTKVPYARYGDQTTGLTLSLSNSKAVGSNREIVQYGFTYDAFSASTVATAHALSNDNACFESGSKRAALVSTGAGSLTDSTWRIFGLASYESNGTSKIVDSDPNFSHYKYVSEQVTVGARLAPVVTTNFWKNIECVVCEEIDEHDGGNRFLLMVNTADMTSYDASTLNEGDGGVDLSTSETGVTIVDSSFYKAGDVVKIGSELCLVESVDSSTVITVRRGYLFTTAAEHNDPAAVYLTESKEVQHTWINRELRGKGNMTSSNTSTRYMWGGFAQIIADNIDFESGPLMVLDSVTAASSVNNEDWYDNGFAIGDIIKVKSNQTENGTYAAPGYYKIMDIRESTGPPDGGDFDYIYIAEHADMLTDEEKLYVSTSITTNPNKTADIVRYDNVRNPTMTCALYNYSAGSNAYVGSSDTVKFEGFVVDDDTTSFILNTDSDTLTVRAVGLHTLDLNTLADSGDIAITDYNVARTGGASASMPLGDRRYPIGSTNSRLGDIGMTINIRILTQAGYRQIYSLVEGDRYDYVFLDSNDVDTPATAYKSYRMKLKGGTISKTSELASQYKATLTMIVLGEEIS